MSRFDLTIEPRIIQPSRPKRPYGQHLIDIDQQRFEVDGVEYRMVLTPFAGSRSLAHFFLHKRIISYPQLYVEQYTTELYPGFMFHPNHLRIDQKDDNRKLIVCVRNPANMLLSAARFPALAFSNDENTETITIDQLQRAVDLNINVNHLKPIIKYWLNGRKPEYFLRAEEQEKELLKLPFVHDAEGYTIYTDESSYDKDQFKYANTHKLKLSKEQKTLTLQYIEDKYSSLIRDLYGEDMEYFGYL